MSSDSPPSISNQNRLYTRFITALKIIQYIGYFLAAAYTTLSFISLSQIPSGANGLGFLTLFTLIWALIACLTVYISTQSLIAIIDLLSRIERNTRIES
ncbi:MAG: hypothetical protein PUP91_08865 [Rhizonema sp. PD37]|nr:hypothetical protein [Rhizonema sp. PD37]